MEDKTRRLFHKALDGGSPLLSLRGRKLKFADLHVHTQASDGWFTSEEAVEQASKAGLAAISVVDHDTVDGIKPAIWAGKKHGVEVIPAIELSSELEGVELHIMGYFIDWRDTWFKNKLLTLQEARVDRAKKIIDKLQRLKINVSFNVVLTIAGGTIGRPHIAQAMLEGGYVQTMDEAFKRYLGSGKPACAEKYPLSSREAIRMIHEIGGISVLAHPKFTKDELLPQLVEWGLRGIEVYHSAHEPLTTKRYEQLARKYDLLITGGSDSHGREIPIGSVRIPYSFVDELKKELVSITSRAANKVKSSKEE